MLRDELYSKIGLVGSLGIEVSIAKKLGIESPRKMPGSLPPYYIPLNGPILIRFQGGTIWRWKLILLS